MTRQKAIKIAQEKLDKCALFLAFLDEQQKQDTFAAKESLAAKIYFILRLLITKEAETLQQIINEIKHDPKKQAKPLRH